MKVPMSDSLRKMRSDPNGLKALWEFMATAKLHERQVITYKDRYGQQVTITLTRGGF
ncbi:hypothetical protein ACFO7E_10090 [Cupriavidus pampae]